MRALILPPEFGERHDERRNALIASESALATETYEVEFQRRDGARFPGEATVSKVEIRARCSWRLHHRRDRARAPPGRARGAAARAGGAAEAERVTELVAGMQALVDAALAHRTLDGILREPGHAGRGVLDADAATIYVADEGERLSVGAHAGRRQRVRRVRQHGGRRARRCSPTTAQAEAGPLVGVPLLAEEVTACWWPPPRHRASSAART